MYAGSGLRGRESAEGRTCVIARYLLVACCGLFSCLSQAQPGSCPDGWQREAGGGRCFLLQDAASSWSEGERFCQKQGGHLAALETLEELLYLETLCASRCWLGGHQIREGSTFRWTWSDCNVAWNSSGPLEQPQPASDGAGCALVAKGESRLVKADCSVAHAFVCSLSQGIGCPGRPQHKEYIIILVAVSLFILTTTLGVLIWLLAFRRTRRRRKSRRHQSPSSAAFISPPWIIFTFSDLSIATANFSDSNRLGEGRGSTYRGVLPDGTVIAVKHLRRSSLQGRRDFLSEVSRIGRLCHRNLVAIRGCCFDNGERYIVYDFVSNGPLDKWLHGLPKGSRSLDWDLRIRIATTAAQGVSFLHDKVKPHVVHRDIRSSNILLDEKFEARVLGVGLVKIIPREAVSEQPVARNYGYRAPEFMYRNELTIKSDVYSFGVLLLEIMSGKKPEELGTNGHGFLEWATPLFQTQRLVEVLDPAIVTIPDVSKIKALVDLVKACTQPVPALRPKMSFVLHHLQSLDVSHISETSEAIQPENIVF